MNPIDGLDSDTVLADTQHWLERAVIGLNLCPFARAVHSKRQIHWVVSAAGSNAEVLAQLKTELTGLVEQQGSQREPTLLILPLAFQEFLDFNAFLPLADKALRTLDLEGDIQIASFHPDYQFGGADEADITHFTNRSPYPILHLLREDSIEVAMKSFASAELIFEKNKQTLTELGQGGWAALDVGPHLKRSL